MARLPRAYLSNDLLSTMDPSIKVVEKVKGRDWIELTIIDENGCDQPILLSFSEQNLLHLLTFSRGE